MAPPDEHRSSFVQFVMASAATGGNTKRSPGGMTTAWERLAHSAALLGYGQLASFVTVVFVAWVSSLEWLEESEDGVPRLNNWTVLNAMCLPIMVLYAAGTCFNIYQFTVDPTSGPRLAMVPFFLGLGLVPTFYGIQAAVLSTETDSTYYGLDLAMMAVYVFVFILLDITIRRSLVMDKTSTQHHESAELNCAPGSTFGTTSETGQSEQETASSNNKKVMFGRGPTLLPYLATCCIGFAYPFSIIPLFFSSAVPTRIAICLFLHPTLLEVAEAFGRGQSADAASAHLREGTITHDIAEMRITQGSALTFGLKQLMAFYRRFMLLNMGSPDATLIALVVTAIEEAASRAFLVQIDTAIRALRGLPELKGNDLRLQRLVWMCDTNQSCIAEFNAILTSTFAHVVLQRHAVIFAIGYETNRGVSTAVMFVQLLVELTLELLVDNTSMRVVRAWAESEHGIPVTRYFAHANGIAVFGLHASVSIVLVCNALYAFIRHPHFSSCGSNDVCDCLDQATFREWVGDACAMGNVSLASEMRNVSESLNSTSTAVEPTLDLFDDVDFFAVVLALISGFAALALIVLAVLFARYRKRQRAVVVALVQSVQNAQQAKLDAEAMNRELKESLARAQRSIDEVTSRNKAQLKPHRIKFAELTFVEEIGHGSFGVVWKGDFRDKPVAIKTVRVTKVSKSVVEDFMKEITIMAPLRHDCLVQLIGGCWEDGPDKLCVVLEYCSRGSLKDLLIDEKSGHSWVAPYFDIALGVASCFRYLHHDQPSGEPLIHRDLKPDNVMICENLSPRVGDFGESTRFDQEEALRRIAEDEGDGMLTMTIVGTPMYVAPEVLEQSPYNMAVDVYSFGITLFEIGCRSHHFVTKQFMQASRYATIEGWRPKPTKELVEMRPGIWKLVQACWHGDAESRPTFVEVARSVRALDPALEPGPSSKPTPTLTIWSDDSAEAPTQESLDDEQRDAKARYQCLSRDELVRRLLEAESSRDEAEDALDHYDLHRTHYDLHVSSDVEGPEGAMRTLASFPGVVPVERSEVRRLLSIEVGAALLQQPPHIGGGVALLRLVRDPDMPTIERARKMLDLRREFDAAGKYEEIRARGLSLHTLPGSAEMREATWQTNEWIGVDAQGDIVTYERFGAVDPKTLMEKMPVEAYKRWFVYRTEARAMVFDALSRRTRRVLYFTSLVDLAGARLEHRRLLPYYREFVAGDAQSCCPDLYSSSFIIQSNAAFLNLFRLSRRLFFSERDRRTTNLFSGNDPFESSADFAARFGRHVLPTTVGGTLQVGNASVQLPPGGPMGALALTDYISTRHESLRRTHTAASAWSCPPRPTQPRCGSGTSLI